MDMETEVNKIKENFAEQVMALADKNREEQEKYFKKMLDLCGDPENADHNLEILSTCKSDFADQNDIFMTVFDMKDFYDKYTEDND